MSRCAACLWLVWLVWPLRPVCPVWPTRRPNNRTPRLGAIYFLTNGQLDADSGWKASAAGMVARTW